MKNHDPRFKRAEELIIDTFIELMNEKGFDSISVNELTKRANINRSTFYAHYEDKSDLLRTIIEKNLDEHLRNYPLNNFSFGEDFIWNILVSVREFIEIISKECGVGFMSIIMQLDIYVREYIRDIIYDKLMDSDYEKENPDREYLAISLSASIFSVMKETHIKHMNLKNKRKNLLPLIYKFD